MASTKRDIMAKQFLLEVNAPMQFESTAIGTRYDRNKAQAMIPPGGVGGSPPISGRKAEVTWRT